MDFLRVYYSGSWRQGHIRAPKESLELATLICLEGRDVFDRILADALTKTVEANSRGAIGDSELAGNLP
jgi:hypothetical protein